jgi:uncharacterized membrane protein
MTVGRPCLIVVLAAGYGLGGAALVAGPPGRVTVIAAFLLPTAVAITDGLLRGLSGDALRTYDAIMLRFGVFIVAVHATTLAALMGLLVGRDWAAQIVPVLLGLTLISIGNLLPRTRPNLAIGVRTRRTLANRAVWIRAHRSTGYLMVVAGAVIVLSAIAVPARLGRTMVLVVGPAGLVGTYLVVRSAGRHAHGDR